MKTKMRKFGAWLMAAALAFAGAGAVQAATVAKIGETSYETLAAAFGAAKDGDTVELLAASYGENDLTAIGKLNDKNVIVVGLGMDKTELKVVYSKSASDVNKLHFQDLTLTINHSGYGMPYTQTLCGTYERVKFNGLIAVDHGTSSFTDCVFTGTTTGDEYILWQYAGVMLVERCTFKASASKGVVKLYCESSYEAQNLVKDCVFESVTGSKGCAIYASNSNNLEKPIYEMNIVGNTIPDGVAEYLASGDGLTVVNPVKDANGKITSGTFITANKNTEQVKGIIGGVVAEGVEIPELVNGQVVIGAAAPEIEVVTPTVSEEKGITQEIADQIASNTEVAKVEDTGLKAALAEDATLKDAEAVVKVELTEVAPTTGVLTYEIKPVVKGETETDISDKVFGKPITFRVPLTDAFTKFAKVTHKGEKDEISHVEVLGAEGSRYVELTFNHFSEVEFDPELAFPGLPETAVKVADGFYQSAATYAGSSDFYIVNKAGLEYLRDFVNRDRTDYSDGPSFDYSSKVFSGKTVHLLVDIDLNNEPWVSIGWNADKSFCGSFNGENHTISNMKIVNETITANKGFYAGLFGYLAWDNTTFQNLTFNNVIVKNVSNYAGALCGRYTKVTGAIKNIKVTGTVDIGATSFVGGIAGHNAAQMSNCSVDAAGQVKSTAGGWCGGIAGYVAENSATVIKECSVKGGVSLTGTNIAVGGITGHVGGANVIKDCTVEAAITGGAAGSTGAIAGKMEGTSAAEIVNNDSTKVVDGNGTVLENQLGGAYSGAATCIVGTGVTYDENGKVNGGTFESLPESAIADGFAPAVDPDTGKIEVEKIKVAEVFDGDVSMGKFETLDAALAAATDGKTLKLLTDLDSIGTKTLNGIVFDGNDRKITGASALYFGPAKTTTIKNVVFENINNAEGTQSAIYGAGFSTGSITITGCTFDTCDWDAIQIVPANGATGEVVITNNVFKHTDTTKSQLRYIHIQHMQETDVHPVPVSMMITDNRFLDVEKSASGEKIDTVSISSVKNTPTTQLSGNYYSDSSTIYVTGDLPLQLYYPMRSQPTVDVDDVPFPMFSIGSATYATLAEAVAAANAANALVTINLNGDLTVDETVEIRNANAKSIAFNGNGHVITANTTMFRVATQLNFTGYNSMSSTPSGLVTCPADSPLFVVDGGTLNVNNGIYTKDITSLINAHLYHLVTNAEGNFIVEMLNDTTALAEGYVAHTSSTGGYYYKTLAELFSEKTIAELLTDVSEDVTASKAVTIRSADKTFVGSVDVGNALNASFYSDATLESVVCNQLYVGYSYATYGVSTVTVKGGTVNALNVNATYGKLIIQGGTFGVDPTAYVDGEIYNVTELGTTPQTWEVTEKTSIAAVVSTDGIQTNEYKKLSSALQVAQEGQKVILLADTAEENVPLKLEQEIVLNGHAFTGTVDPANVPAGYDSDVVTTPDGKSFIAPAKIEVPIGESSVIKVRMLGTAESLAAPQANGRQLWANQALGIANDFVIKPQVERPEVGSKTISIKSNISGSVLEAAAQQRDGVSVKFQLAKKVGSVGTYVQFGEKQLKPEFTVEADEQEVQTFWKIQIFFEEEY